MEHFYGRSNNLSTTTNKNGSIAYEQFVILLHYAWSSILLISVIIAPVRCEIIDLKRHHRPLKSLSMAKFTFPCATVKARMLAACHHTHKHARNQSDIEGPSMCNIFFLLTSSVKPMSFNCWISEAYFARSSSCDGAGAGERRRGSSSEANA